MSLFDMFRRDYLNDIKAIDIERINCGIDILDSMLKRLDDPRAKNIVQGYKKQLMDEISIRQGGLLWMD